MKPKLTREIKLDFIRGIAILLVIDFHSSHPFLTRPFSLMGLPHIGWIGVDMFFVLSGFLVGGLLMKEWKVRRGIDSKRFLIRRGFKIWPQYYFYLAVMLLTRHRSFGQLWGNLLNIQNYTGGVAHTWSLAVEEHVYLLLVLCLAVAARRKARLRSLFLFLSGVCVVVAIERYVLTARGFSVFAPTNTRLDGIVYGVLLAMLYHFSPERFDRLRSLRWVWLLSVVVSLAVFARPPAAGWQASIPYEAGNLFSIATLLLLYRPRLEGRHNPLYRFVAWIGLYSYGIYLWHPSVVAPIGAFAERHPGTPTPLVALAIPIAGICLGAATTRLIEFPALRLRDRLFPRRVDTPVGIPAEIEAPAGVPASL